MSRLALLLVAVLGVACARTEGGAAATTTLEHAAIAVEPFPPPPAAIEPIRVLVGGDLIPHRPSLEAPSAIRAALAPLAPLFGAADAAIANYETATGALGPRAFRLAYAASPAWLEALPAAGITAISVANNHACDLGRAGVGATLAAAADVGLIALGADPEGDPWQPRTIAERDGKRVCAVAWTTFVNADRACAKSTRLAIAREDAAGRQKVATAIERARAHCDATIAVMHGGVEYVRQTPEVMAVARQAAESGADAVVIHHPHVASPVVVHVTKDGRSIPIFASVGNLASNQGESWRLPMFPVLADNRRLVCVNGWTRLGVLADLSFDFRGAPALAWGFHLLWTDNDHAEDRARLPNIATRLLDPDEDAALLSRLEDDRVGPTELFRDPCWIERPAEAEGERPREARCATTLVRSPAPAAVARAKGARKKRR